MKSKGIQCFWRSEPCPRQLRGYLAPLLYCFAGTEINESQVRIALLILLPSLALLTLRPSLALLPSPPVFRSHAFLNLLPLLALLSLRIAIAWLEIVPLFWHEA